MDLLLTLALVLLFAKLAESLAIKVGMPYVLGSLVVGILVGPALLGWIQDGPEIHFLAEIGVILLMFIAGLEADLKVLKKYLKPSILVGTLGVFIPAIMFAILSLLFDFSLESSIFIGLIFGATSLSITIQVLKELHYIKTKEGSLVIGAVVLDDIIVILLLNIMLNIFSTGTSNWSILLMLGSNIVFFIFLFLFNKFILTHFIRFIRKMKAPQMSIAMGLAMCFGFSYLASLMGMSDIVGAFFSGILLSQTKIGHHLERSVESITFSFFAPIFFISIGLKISFDGIWSNIFLIIVFTIFAFVSKFLAGYIGAKVSGFTRTGSSIVGASLVSRGEMALILINLGLTNKLIDDEIYGAFVLVIIITTIIAPVLLKKIISGSSEEKHIEIEASNDS